MKSLDIITQLITQLPRHTPLFSDTVGVSSITFASGTGSVLTSSAHGLSTGDVVTVSGALSPNILTSLTQVDGVATAVTTDDHDLTLDQQIQGISNSDEQTINITGAADSEYNGDKKLIDVINRRTFTYEVDRLSPASTTGGVLNETKNYAYNGSFSITVTGTNTFDYSISGTVGSPASGSPTLGFNTRVSGAVTLDKSILSYTKQSPNNLWAFVVLGDTSASKSRFTNNDADMVRGPGTDPRQKLIQNFSVYIYAPTKNEIAARAARDQMEDVMLALFKSLLGYKPPTVLCEGAFDSITFVEHGVEIYQDSFYIHRFQFQNLVDVTFDDTLNEDIDVAFRDIHIDYADPVVTDGDDIIMTSDIDLDEEPM